jgi:hypothetical protein
MRWPQLTFPIDSGICLLEKTNMGKLRVHHAQDTGQPNIHPRGIHQASNGLDTEPGIFLCRHRNVTGNHPRAGDGQS